MQITWRNTVLGILKGKYTSIDRQKLKGVSNSLLNADLIITGMMYRLDEIAKTV